MQIIESIVWLASLVIGVWYMIGKNKNIPVGQPSQAPLTGKEKLFVFVLCLFNPLILGAVFYYGWKNKLPAQAKTANLLSFGAFAIFLIIYFGSVYLFVKKVGTANIKNIANNVAQVQSLDQQASAIAANPDPTDAADIQAIIGKVGNGYNKAKLWQADAKWFSYRRVFTLPDNIDANDKILSQADSYYYESQATQDFYEVLTDKNSNNILRIDTDTSQRQGYINDFTDINTIKIGPDKALQIAMLSPTFQNYKQTHSQILSLAILNPTDNAVTGTTRSQNWLLELSTGFSDPGVEALVNIQTGELISPEAVNAVNQIKSAAQK